MNSNDNMRGLKVVLCMAQPEAMSQSRAGSNRPGQNDSSTTTLAWLAILKSQSHWLRPWLWSSSKVLKIGIIVDFFLICSNLWLRINEASSNFNLHGHTRHHSLPSFLPFFIFIALPLWILIHPPLSTSFFAQVHVQFDPLWPILQLFK